MLGSILLNNEITTAMSNCLQESYKGFVGSGVNQLDADISHVNRGKNAQIMPREDNYHHQTSQ